MSDSSLQNELTESIDTIESGYEFLLAYAAQGRHTDRDATGGQSPRERLQAMAEAMDRLPTVARAMASSVHGNDSVTFDAFLDALERDAAVSVAAVRLVLSKRDLSSQIVDNLNASIHLRALLTDIFLIDEAFKG
ncbi:MAG: hypothetical protein PVH89_05905 [Gammaproteobacteria bacterium]|jgi:hypothetical protein